MSNQPRAVAGDVSDRPPTAGQRFWRRFCRLAVAVFYRRREVVGLEHLPASGPVILCANHANALADAVIVQAACPRPIHPLARSGLFRRPLLRPLLRMIQAIPVYRRRPDQDTAQGEGRNDATFARCFEVLEEGRVLLIFPEGQSHSDPSLRPIKTGAARLALGLKARGNPFPAVIPVGLTFAHKGRFRSRVLIQIGRPVPFDDAELATLEERAAVDAMTDDIAEGLREVTLNVESWEDLALIKQVQIFEMFRQARERRDGMRTSMSHRYRAFRRLIDTHRWLRRTCPEDVARVREKLRRFSRLRRRYGIRNYQLDLRYRPAIVLAFSLRVLVFVVFVFPLALWGLVHSGLPYLATRWMARRSALGRDQYDSASMLFGFVFFLFFWSVQVFFVWRFFGLWPAAGAYAASLPLTAAIALKVGRERQRILENIRVFFLFTRRRRLREYLRAKRTELEGELARLAQRARSRLAETGGTKPPAPE